MTLLWVLSVMTSLFLTAPSLGGCHTLAQVLPKELGTRPWFGPKLSHIDTEGYYPPNVERVFREIVRI